MEEQTTYYESLMAAYFSGEASPGEIRQLSAWLIEDQAHLDTFEATRKAWLITGKDALSSGIDLDSEWKQISSKLAPAPPKTIVVAETGRKGRIFNIISSWKAAAAIAIILLCATAIFYLNSAHEIVIVRAETANLEQVLPDGTTVSLLKGSEIEYPAGFSETQRMVKLKGEAYFNVKHDDKKPFIVSGNHAMIKVMGTSFNVNTKAGDDKVNIVLTSGKVSLYFEGRESENIIIHPGEKAEMIVSERIITTGINTDPNYMAWKTGKIIFENNNLSEVIAVLSKVYDQKFRLDNIHLSDCSLTATFEKQPLISIIKVIEITLDVEIREVNGIMVINGSGCNE